MVTKFFFCRTIFSTTFKRGCAGSTTELYQKHCGNFIHLNKKTFIITWKLLFKHHMLHYTSCVIVYEISRLLSTWMKGKSSPTAKLESQLTVPAIMNAAGLCDCWKNSPVRTNGIPPETGSKSMVLVNFLCQQLFHLERWTRSCQTPQWPALLHSAMLRCTQGLLSQ